MKKRNALIIVMAAIMILLSFVACQPKADFIIPDVPTHNYPGGNGVLTSQEQANVKGALKTVFAKIGNATSAATNESWENDVYSGAYDLTLENGGWNLHAWGNYKSSTEKLSARSVTPNPEYDIEIWTSSADIASKKPITVALGGESSAQSVPYDEVIDNTVTVPPTSTEWDISARLAKHSRGASEDYDNWKYVTVDYSNGVANVEIALSDMAKFTSSDPTQAEKGDKPWFAVLIGTGIDDITTVSFNGSILPEEEISNRNDMVGYDDTAANDDEFVLWLCADDMIGAKTKTYTLSRDGADDVELTFNFTQVMGNNDYKIMLADFTSFGHDRVLRDIKSIIEGGQYTGFKPERDGKISSSADAISYNGSSEIRIILNAEEYKFCGSSKNITATGTITLVLTGKEVEDNKFEADRYTVDSDEVTISNNGTKTAYNLEAVSGVFTQSKMTNVGQIGTEPDPSNIKPLVFTVNGNSVTGVDFKTAQENNNTSYNALWFPDEGTITIGTMQPVTIAEIVDAAK